LKPRSRGRSSEEIAAEVLEELGYTILEMRKRVVLNGVEVAEVDIVAEKDGVRYAVEVKAGAADVGTIRHAYANARLLGMRPLVVARGFSNEAARIVAERLGVEVIELSDMFVVDGEEMYLVVKEAVKEVMQNIISRIIFCPTLEDHREVLKALASSDSFAEAAEKLGVSVEELADKVVELKKKGVLATRGGFKDLKFDATLLLLCNALAGVRDDKGCSV